MPADARPFGDGEEQELETDVRQHQAAADGELLVPHPSSPVANRYPEQEEGGDWEK